jgi:probable phosphoglycerate mutase
MNHLEKVGPLKNRYVLLRHGESEANEAGLIISNLERGLNEYGLTALGREQVASSVVEAKEKGVLNNEAIIYSSDFKRAAETANIAREKLNSDTVHLTPALRERYFGDFDNKSHKNYVRVWANDISKRADNSHNVEALENVLARTTKLIIDLENEYSNKTILLVGHADTLQVLQTAFEGVHPSRHRLLNSISVAEVRELKQKVV